MSSSIKLGNVCFISTQVAQKTDYLLNYLKDRADILADVSIPSPLNKKARPECRLYLKGELKDHFYLFFFGRYLATTNDGKRTSLYFLYYFGVLIAIFHCLIRLRIKFDIFLGNGFIYTFWGTLFKKIRICKKIIFYRGDYFEHELSNVYTAIGSTIFQCVDRFNINNSDAVWNLTKRLRDTVRCKCEDMNCRHKIVKPLGMVLYREHFQSKTYEKFNILYMGNLEDSKGVGLLIETLPGLIHEIPDIKFHIVGKDPFGHYEVELKKIIHEKNISQYVVFHGPVPTGELLDGIITQCVLGVALYKPLSFNYFTYYTEPGKIKDYLSYGLPVITTNIAEISSEIAENEVGIVIGYSVHELQKALLYFAKNRELLKAHAANIFSMASRYTPEKILDKAFGESFDYWRVGK